MKMMINSVTSTANISVPTYKILYIVYQHFFQKICKQLKMFLSRYIFQQVDKGEEQIISNISGLLKTVKTSKIT